VQPPPVESVLWGLGTALKLLLCFFAFYRRLYRRLPWLTFYLALLPAEVAVVWWAYREWGYTSSPAWYAYWSALGIVLIARALVIAELCLKSLASYPGLWSVMRKLLVLAGSILLLWAGVAAARNAYWISAFVLTTEQDLEFSGAVILTLLVAISVCYRVWLGSVERNIAFGLALYSIFQAMNHTFLSRQLMPYFPWWDSVRVASFDAAMVFWLLPLLKPLKDQEPQTPLLSETVAADLLHQSLAEMRDATEKLRRLGNATRK
jgi:hypothetical protein